MQSELKSLKHDDTVNGYSISQEANSRESKTLRMNKIIPFQKKNSHKEDVFEDSDQPFKNGFHSKNGEAAHDYAFHNKIGEEDFIRRSARNIKHQMQTEKNVQSIKLFEKFEIEDKALNRNLYDFLQENSVQFYYIVLTFYTLFADDYRLLNAPKELDFIFDCFTMLAIMSFSCEIVMSVFAKVGYMNSYFFRLDVLSTFSLVFDIVYIKDMIIDIGRSGSGAIGFTKIGKVLRLIRLFRLIRISKVFKSISNNEPESNSDWEEEKKKKKNKGSKVGKRLSDLSTKRVILTIFIMMLILPFFDSSFWLKNPDGIGAVCLQLRVMLNHKYDQNVNFNSITFNDEINSDSIINQEKHINNYVAKIFSEFGDKNILQIDFPNTQVTYYLSGDFSDFRKEEMTRESCTYNSGEFLIYENNGSKVRFEAVINIFRTVFVSFLLFGASLLFGRDIYNLVINPIERMIEKVKEVIFMPQRTKERAFIKNEEEENNKLIKRQKISWRIDEQDNIQRNDNKLETAIIERAIEKIGVLLGIGLGEAGSGIIERYLGANAEVDILVAGQHTNAIFGFCDIRNFTDVTEILEEEIMVFVNKIAEIVHSITDKYLGTANKNVGDAFLLVWKCPNIIKKKRGISDISEDFWVRANIADLALFAFMKIFAEINRAPTLLEYIKDQRIQKRKGLGPNYKVRLGCGLHYGWAIEGAIGSHYKLDASYLSPNVKLSEDLECLTKEHLVPVLISGEFYDCLSDFTKEYCLKVDIIYNPGREEPLRIYTPVMSDKAITFPQYKSLKMYNTPLKDSFTFKQLIKREIMKNALVGPSLFHNDLDIPLLTCFNNKKFLSSFKTAFNKYVSGDWNGAKENFDKARTIDNDYGPLKSLYKYMEKRSFKPPSGWKGVRTLK